MTPETSSPPAPAGQHAITLLAAATVLALLYFGREVLVPIVLALFLSLLIEPWVRLYRRLGLGHGPSVLVAVLAAVLIAAGLTAVIGSQVVHMARGLPQYEATIHSKVQTLRTLTLGRLELVRGEFGKVIDAAESPPGHAVTPSAQAPDAGAAAATAAPATPMAVMARLLSTAWIPLQTAGIVLVVLVFVLLEHESLRDRFIRLAGGADLRATTAAINDAGERLSRFFLSTFSVNVGVGVAIWAGLSLLGLPSAPLWGALTAALRFVPYVGIWLVAALAVLFAAAVGQGWSLVVMTVVLYLAVELIVSQLIEPFLYGHTTGLSPLAVVVAAIFWSWLWGPVGLVMSTPLTLCLVVAGQHMKAFGLLTILLGDAPALTMPQRLYQRALSGDAGEIVAEARGYLKRKTFAAYCDVVLLPALQLARIDLSHGAISPEQQAVVRNTLVAVVEALGGEGRHRSRRRRGSVLDDVSIGRRLRRQREDVSGRWQGPLKVPPGSVVLCVGMGTVVDDLATELLTRVLRDLHIDARHLAVEDFAAFDAEEHRDMSADAVSIAFIVSTDPAAQRESVDTLAVNLRRRVPQACIIVMRLPEPLAARELNLPVGAEVDDVAHSLEEAAQQAISRFPENGT
ncbi:AI-2E family transporter [Dyella sedimenti]|uniref:AI-2E family transporter n=1 Tax=Dyella sedimenti TaxID=2919947 RepID=UPI001FA9AA29|nr:AI-2E family transporter [Dyella sedimenti]